MRGGGGKWLLLLSVLAAAVCLLPAAAAAAQKEQVGAGGIFKLDASNGYSIMVLAGSRRADGKGTINLIVSRKQAAAIYSAPAIVTPTAIQADLGALGRVEVDLVPSGMKKTKRSLCEGPITLETASYEGVIEFHGEGGYTDVSVTRAPSLARLFFDFLCSGSMYGDESGPGLPGARLNVGKRDRRSGLSLEVKKNRPGAKTALNVEVFEKKGEITIERTTSLVVGSAAFEYDPLLRTATVDPPLPFAGEGVFHRAAPSARRWTGNLTVDLPGRLNLPLTGPNLPVRLVHAHWSKEIHH